jgi:acyl-CoA thioesterase
MSTTPEATSFTAATAVTALGDGRYAATLDSAWATPRGPNGGYLAALVLRAIAAEVTDPAKAPRSLTCHFLRPPADGSLEIEVRREREGRAVASLSARMLQDGETCLLAVAAFGVPLDSALDYADLPMPDVPAALAVDAIEPHPKMPPIAQQMELRPVLGPHAFSSADEAVTGGWIRMREAVPADAFAIAQYTDAWIPAPFARLDGPVGAPTIDLTVHFRRTLPLPGVDPLAPVLLHVASTTSAEGYFEEDTAIWAADGTLLAQSRQLALLRPRA